MLRSKEWRGVSWAVVLIAALGACEGDSATAPNGEMIERVAVVVNSGSRTLTLVPVTEATPRPRTVELGARGTPTTLAARGQFAVVPMGSFAAALVVNLATGAVLHTVPLPDGSGATGVAFLNDSVAVVANPGLNSVTPVNVLRGTAGAPVPVGATPHVVKMIGTRMFVMGGQPYDPAAPERTGTITVFDSQLRALGQIVLQTADPRDIARRGTNLLVLSAATGGAADPDGTLAVYEGISLRGSEMMTGFGTTATSLAVDARGEVWVGSPGIGILLYSLANHAFVRSIANPVRTEGLAAVSRVTTDPAGLVYALAPGSCTLPGSLMRITPEGEMAGHADTGICPRDVDFADVKHP